MKKLVRRNFFTIIEALVASFVLAMATVAFISLMTMATEISDLMDRRQNCMQLAVKRVEQLRNRPYNEVDFFAEPDRVRINHLGVSDPDGQYWRTTVLNRDGIVCPVVVTVFSNGTFLKRPTQYELSTVIIDYDEVHGQHE